MLYQQLSNLSPPSRLQNSTALQGLAPFSWLSERDQLHLTLHCLLEQYSYSQLFEVRVDKLNLMHSTMYLFFALLHYCSELTFDKIQ